MSEEEKRTKEEIIHEINDAYYNHSSDDIKKYLRELDGPLHYNDFPPDLHDFVKQVDNFEIFVNSLYYELNEDKTIFQPHGQIYIFELQDDPKWNFFSKINGKKELKSVRVKKELVHMGNDVNFVKSYNYASSFVYREIEGKTFNKLFKVVLDEYSPYSNPKKWSELKDKKVQKIDVPKYKKKIEFISLKAKHWLEENEPICLKPKRSTYVRITNEDDYLTLMRVYELAGWKSQFGTVKLPTYKREWKKNTERLFASAGKETILGKGIYYIYNYENNYWNELSLDEFFEKQNISSDLIDKINEWYEK